jgi:hypothetical protein
MLPLKRDKRFRQGIYTPKNPKKYMGKTAIYRSGLECKFFMFCDNNPNVVKWGSENVIVPYVSKIDGKWHKYYVDNYVEILEGNTVVKYLIEIKPHKQTKKPEVKKGKKKSSLLYEQTQWIINAEGKWPAAEKYCKDRGWKFLILTEKHLL